MASNPGLQIAILVVALAPLRTGAQGQPLDAGTCGRSEVPVTHLLGVAISGWCDASTPTLSIGVLNEASNGRGRLLEFSIGFCDRAIKTVTVPAGWTWEIDDYEARQRVRFRASEGQGLAAGQRRVGFHLTLTANWRRSLQASASWESGGTGTGGGHDCRSGEAAEQAAAADERRRD